MKMDKMAHSEPMKMDSMAHGDSMKMDNMASSMGAMSMGPKVVKTEEEWRAVLSPEQVRAARLVYLARYADELALGVGLVPYSAPERHRAGGDGQVRQALRGRRVHLCRLQHTAVQEQNQVQERVWLASVLRW